MTARNIIYCQSTDVAQVARIAGKAYTHVILASLHLHDDNGRFALTLNDTALADVSADFWGAVASLQKSGITVSAMLGGTGNGTWQCVEDDLEQAANVLAAAMAAHRLQGFDLAWETYPQNNPTILGNLTNALVAAQPSAIVTHAPVPHLLTTYTPAIWSLLGDHLAWLNVQWYGNYNLVGDYTDFVGGTTSGAKVDPSRVVCGATVASQPRFGYTPLCTLMPLIAQLRATYPTLGGVAGWEFTRTIGSSDPTVAQWDACIDAALGGNSKCAACP